MSEKECLTFAVQFYIELAEAQEAIKTGNELMRLQLRHHQTHGDLEQAILLTIGTYLDRMNEIAQFHSDCSVIDRLKLHAALEAIFDKYKAADKFDTVIVDGKPDVVSKGGEANTINRLNEISELLTLLPSALDVKTIDEEGQDDLEKGLDDLGFPSR